MRELIRTHRYGSLVLRSGGKGIIHESHQQGFEDRERVPSV